MNIKLNSAVALAVLGLAAGVPAMAASPATATFQVKMTILQSCSVVAGAASDIVIGAAGGVDADSGSHSGNSTISVTCSKTTPYYVGLRPSNNDTAGAGTMAGAAHADNVPYQLTSVSAAGPVWGDTATSTSVGNGVAGTGNGAAQSIPVFATAPSANYTPDAYADTVTVNVNF